MESTISEKQLAANRENAKHAGVKTAAGKAASRFNARKHGILGELKTKYEGKLVDDYKKQLLATYEPEGFMECLLVERIADYCLMLARARKAEWEFMRTRIEPPISDRLGLIDYDEQSYRPTMKQEDVTYLVTVYLRYQTTIENRIYKAMHELERLQRMRRGEDIPLKDGKLVPEHHNGFQYIAARAKSRNWRALVDDFRTANWLELVRYPELVMQQLDRFLKPLLS